MLTKRFWLLTIFVIVGVVAASCATPTSAPMAQPTSTPQMAEPSPTPVPPTDTPASTPEPEMATDTPEPPAPTPTHAMSMDDNGMTWQPDGMVTDGEYTDQVEIAGVTFAWTTDNAFLYGAMWAKTKGWVAVGFDPTNRMQGANYIFGYVQDGEVSIADMFGVKPAGPGSHPPDTTLGGTDDIVMSGGSEKDGVTLIEFKIPLDSGDANDTVLSPGKHMIIAAYGPTDDFGTIHTNRGGGEITIN